MIQIVKTKWLACLITIALTVSLWGCTDKQETTAPEATSTEAAEQTSAAPI